MDKKGRDCTKGAKAGAGDGERANEAVRYVVVERDVGVTDCAQAHEHAEDAKTDSTRWNFHVALCPANVAHHPRAGLARPWR